MDLSKAAADADKILMSYGTAIDLHGVVLQAR
jgi:hypothetical protein